MDNNTEIDTKEVCVACGGYPVEVGVDLSELDSISVTQIVTLKLGRGNGKYNGTIEELKRILETSDTPIPICIEPLTPEVLAFKKEMDTELLKKFKKDMDIDQKFEKDRRRPNK